MAAPDKPERSRSGLARWWNDLRQDKAAGRLTVIFSFVVVAVFLLPRTQVRPYRVEAGRVWQEPDLTAPFAFPVRKPNALYEQQRQQAAARVPEVFLLNTEAYARAEASLNQLYDSLRAASQAYRRPPAEIPAFLPPQMAGLGFNPNPNTVWPILREPARVVQMRQASLELLAQLKRRGYIDREQSSIVGEVVSLREAPQVERLVDRRTLVDAKRLQEMLDQRSMTLPSAARALFQQIFTYSIRPLYQYNDALYRQDRNTAMASISRFQGKVDQGQVIIARDQRITPAMVDMVESLNAEKRSNTGDRAWFAVLLGQLIMVSLLTLLTVNFLRTNRQEVFYRNRKLALLFFIFVLTTAMQVGLAYLGPSISSPVAVNYAYLVPMSMAAIMVTVFFDDRIGFFANLVVSLLAGLVIHHNFEYAFIQVCAGSIAVNNMTGLRRRQQFFTAAGSLLLTYWMAYISYNLYVKGDLEQINYANLLLLAINVLVTLAAFPLIYLIERLFGLTSDLTYIELLDTEHPLLKELSLKAPGTYQHSLAVATLAEAVAVKIGANALQVKVGALFHDIGKIHQPDYFVENQHGYNPHEHLGAQESAEIIINHVDYGVELARQHHLPQEVMDLIRTHHGTSRVEHFYRTYVREHPEIRREDCDPEFRYKGPLPTTKEMAILMLADSAEAASRSLQNTTTEELAALIDAVINHKIADGQLAKARITFRDVNSIKKEILHILATMHHTRSAYAPEPEPAEA